MCVCLCVGCRICRTETAVGRNPLAGHAVLYIVGLNLQKHTVSAILIENLSCTHPGVTFRIWVDLSSPQSGSISAANKGEQWDEEPAFSAPLCPCRPHSRWDQKPSLPHQSATGPHLQDHTASLWLPWWHHILTHELLDLSLIHIVVLFSAATVSAEDHYDVLPIRKGMIVTVLWHLTGIMRWWQTVPAVLITRTWTQNRDGKPVRHSFLKHECSSTPRWH